MENREIKNIRTYQAVKIDGKLDTFFTAEKIPTKSAISLKLHASGVILESATDCVLVPFANISGVYYFTESDARKKAEKEAAEAHFEANKTVNKIQKIKVDPIGAKR